MGSSPAASSCCCSAAVGAAALTAEEVDERRSSEDDAGHDDGDRGDLLALAEAAISALRPWPAAWTSETRECLAAR